jgi:hypothetical protein
VESRSDSTLSSRSAKSTLFRTAQFTQSGLPCHSGLVQIAFRLIGNILFAIEVFYEGVSFVTAFETTLISWW